MFTPKKLVVWKCSLSGLGTYSVYMYTDVWLIAVLGVLSLRTFIYFYKIKYSMTASTGDVHSDCSDR